VYGRREKRGREAEEKGKKYTTLCNILQSKKCKEAGANKYRAPSYIWMFSINLREDEF